MTKPYYSTPDATVYNARTEDVLPLFPDSHFDLIAVDPPYFRVKDEPWDRQWDTPEGFLAWIGELCQEWRRILKPNGSLYVFASPEMSRRVEAEIGRYFHVLNRITWIKEAGWHQKADKEALRSYLSPWEAIVFAEQYGDQYGDAERALHKEVYAPLGRYIQTERERAGLTRSQVEVLLGYCSKSDPTRGTALCYRWEEGACLPSEETYLKLRETLNRLGNKSAEYLRRDYEELRRDYEDLRRPFNAEEPRENTDIWDFPTVPAAPDKHPCEKPLRLMKQIILASTKPGALVLDCFMGTGATGAAAVYNGRRFVGIEAERRYCERSMGRLSQGVLDLEVAR